MTDNIQTNCARCGSALEISPDSDGLICVSCGTAYDVRQPNEDLVLVDIDEAFRRAVGKEEVIIIETRLAEIEEALEETHSEIDTLRARELSGPLQLGCAFFGVFAAILAVIAIFMLLGKNYFGGWVFYACLAVVILVGIVRIRRKLGTRIPADQLRRERVQLEESLARLEAEVDRLRKLRARIRADEPASGATLPPKALS